MSSCQLIVDDREQNLISSLVELGVSHCVEHLDVGDIVFRINGQMAGIFERKTASDFAASIIDGRWNEQKGRLAELRLTLRCGESLVEQGAPVGYIFEGNFFCSKRTHSIQPATLLKSATLAATRDGFCVLHFSNFGQTAAAIGGILAEMPFVGYSEARVVQRLQNAGYASAPPSLSKRERDSAPNIVFLRLLRCIPGVSAAVAFVILSKYKTLPKLAAALQSEEGRKTISILQRRARGGGKGRRLGPTVVSQLAEHFTGLNQTCKRAKTINTDQHSLKKKQKTSNQFPDEQRHRNKS